MRLIFFTIVILFTLTEGQELHRERRATGRLTDDFSSSRFTPLSRSILDVSQTIIDLLMINIYRLLETWLE